MSSRIAMSGASVLRTAANAATNVTATTTGMVSSAKVGTTLATQVAAVLFRGVQKRTIVSKAIAERTRAMPRFTLDKSTTPFQLPGLCVPHAIQIIKQPSEGAVEDPSFAERRSAWPSTPVTITPLDRQKAEELVAECNSEELQDANHLVELCNTHKACVLYGPGLADRHYLAHALAICAVLHVPVEDSKRYVLVAMDCSDEASDPQTEAAKDLAWEKYGNAHLSVLTHADAHSVDVDRRRIRLIDIESVVTLMRKAHDAWARSSWDQNGLTQPTVMTLNKGNAWTLTADELSEMTAMVAKRWDEVERYDGVSNPYKNFR